MEPSHMARCSIALTICATVMSGMMLSGCVHPRTLTREEYLSTTQKVYADSTPEQVFTASEKLFKLADGDDFSLSWTEDSLRAYRRWTVYLVLAASVGTDVWLVQAKKEPDGTHVRVGVTTTAAAISPTITTGGDWTATQSGGLPGPPVQGTAIYDVFWSRLDYLLGKTNHWMTCDEANARVHDKVTWGTNEALCNSFNMKDRLPDGVKPPEEPKQPGVL